MALVYAGSISIGALCPLVLNALGDVSIAIAASFEGAGSLNASLSLSPPTLTAVVAALVQIDAQISAALALGLPSVSFNINAAAALIAKLELAFSLLAVLTALLNASIGILGYSYTGVANQMGASVTAELAAKWPDGTPSSANVNAFMFGMVANASLSPATLSIDKFKAFMSGLHFGTGLVYAGSSLSLAALCPVVELAIGQGDAAITAQLEGAFALQASLSVTPPSFSATLTALASYQASLVANVELALPSVSFALDATASLIADLNAKFSAVIQLGLTIGRFDAVAFAYTYSGTGAALGPAIATALATTWGDGTTLTSGACVAALLGATNGATFSAMSTFFGGI